MEAPRKMLILLKLLILQSALAEGANILALLNLASPSHYIFNRVLMVELANRGHQVTVVSFDAEKQPVANLSNILLEGVYDKLKQEYGDYSMMSEISAHDMVYTLEDWGVNSCQIALNTNGARQLLKHPGPFDLIFVESGLTECFLGFVYHFGHPPTIALSGIGIFPWTGTYLGTPEFPSYVVNFMLNYDPENMGLLEKFYNAVLQWLSVSVANSYMDRHDALARALFGQDMPHIGDIARNISMAFVNTAPGIDPPRPLAPAMVPIGGMHVQRDPRPLSADLKAYLDDAKDGVVFFSLGSNLKSTGLSLEMRDMFLEAFRQMAPVRILWKWEDESLPNKPENVKISKWLPQRDLLAHPNIRAFISHCGKMSTLEAAYCGVPVVGIPFFLDQAVNAQKLQRLGVAIALELKTLTYNKLLDALKEVVQNASYRHNMQQLSAVFRDQPQHPLDRAVFWTEYVLRHGHKTSKILRPASVNLSWYQYFLLDVLLVVLGVVMLVFVLVLVLVRCIWRTLVGKPTKKSKTQ